MTRMMELRAKVEVMMTKMSPTKKMSPMTQTTVQIRQLRIWRKPTIQAFDPRQPKRIW